MKRKALFEVEAELQLDHKDTNSMEISRVFLIMKMNHNFINGRLRWICASAFPFELKFVDESVNVDG